MTEAVRVASVNKGHGSYKIGQGWPRERTWGDKAALCVLRGPMGRTGSWIGQELAREGQGMAQSRA
jgi:hypothetical protein